MALSSARWARFESLGSIGWSVRGWKSARATLRRALDHSSDSPRARVIVVVLLAVIVRLGVLGVVGFEIDGPTRIQIVAENLHHGLGYTTCNRYFPFCGPENRTTASVAPLPVVIFSGFMGVFGTLGIPAILLLNVLLGGSATWLAYKVANQIVGRTDLALACALGFALYVPMIGYGLRLRAEVLGANLILAAMWALSSSLATDRNLRWVGVGALFGLCALTRFAMLYFPFVLALVLPVLLRGSVTRRLAVVGCLLLGFGLVMTPWVARNAVAFGGFVPGGTLNGYNLYRHNHILENESYLRYVEPDEASLAVESLLSRRVELSGAENELEMNSVYSVEAVRIIRNHPWRYLHLSFARAIGLMTPVRKYDEWPAIREMGPLGALNAAMLALSLFVVVRRNVRLTAPAVLAALLLLYYVGGHMAVNTKLRYAGPIIPIVYAFGLRAIWELRERLVRGRRRAFRELPKPALGMPEKYSRLRPLSVLR